MAKQKANLNTDKNDCTRCKSCAADYQADNLRHEITRVDGVSNVKMDGVTGKVVVLNKPKAFLKPA